MKKQSEEEKDICPSFSKWDGDEHKLLLQIWIVITVHNETIGGKQIVLSERPQQ